MSSYATTDVAKSRSSARLRMLACNARFSGDVLHFHLYEPTGGRVQSQQSARTPVEPRQRVIGLSAPKPVIAQSARWLNANLETLRTRIRRQDGAERGERHDRPTTEMLEENCRLRAETKESLPTQAAAVSTISRLSRHTSEAGCHTNWRTA
jgi:transposase